MKARILTTQHTNLYSVKIDVRHRGNTMIGFSTRDPEGNDQNRYYSFWFLNLYNGKLYSSNGNWGLNYTSVINEGDLITVIFNSQQFQVSFLVNSKDLGIAFKNVNESKLYPTTEIVGEGAKITLV